MKLSSEAKFGLLLLSPSILTLGIFSIYPAIWVLWLSFNERVLFQSGMDFVGLQNYQKLLSSPTFYFSLINTSIWTIGTVTLQVLVGLGTALLLNKDLRLRSLVRAVALFPYVLPIIVTTFIWSWMFSDVVGIINYLLVTLGLTRGPLVWLGDPDMAMVVAIFVGFWKFFPFATIAFLAAIVTIPVQLYEAAKIDGAGSVKQFIHVTLPQLQSIILLIIIFRTIWMYTNFDLVWLLTRGGPAMATHTLPIYAYRLSFIVQDYSLGGTVSVLTFLTIGLFVLVYFMKFRPARGETN